MYMNLEMNLKFCFFFSTDQKTKISRLIKSVDVHAVAGLLKLYFRELPEPLFTHSLYTKFVDGLGKLLKYGGDLWVHYAN